MSIQSFFKSLTSPPTRRLPSRRRAQTSRLLLEALEDRCLPSTFTVTNLLDAGAGSLRAAVRMYKAQGRVNADAILRFASVCRVARVARPYLESLL